MLPKYALTDSMEAISFQKRESFFLPLVAEIKNYRENYQGSFKTATLKNTRIAELISKRFNFTNVSVEVEDVDYINAYSQNEFFDVNNPLLRGILKAYNFKDIRQIKSTPDFLRKLKENNEAIGGVDLKKAKVSGFFSAIAVKLSLTRGLLEASHITDEGIAAILCHEIGHSFTFYEKFGVHFTTNLALSAMIHRAVGLDSQQDSEKVVIYQTMRKVYNIEIDPEYLATLNNPNAIQVIVIDKYRESLHSEHGSTLYDGISSEFTADNFAVRLGAGPELLATLAAFMYSPPSMAVYVGQMTVLCLLIAVVVVTIPAFIIVYLALLGLTLTFAPYGEIYDEPKVRLIRIKQGMIQELKDPKLPTLRRSELSEIIKNFDKAINSFNYEFGIITLIGQNITAIRRKEYQNRKLQQDLEAIGSNDLYVQSGRIQSYV